MRTLMPIAPVLRALVPSQSGPAVHRSAPSCVKSICIAWARRPGPRAKSSRPAPPRRSAKCVPCGITDGISFRLDDAPAKPAIVGIVHRYFANQVARQLHSTDREFCLTETPETTNGSCLAHAFVIRNLLTHSGRSRKQGLRRACWSPVAYERRRRGEAFAPRLRSEGRPRRRPHPEQRRSQAGIDVRLCLWKRHAQFLVHLPKRGLFRSACRTSPGRDAPARC